MTPYLIRRLLLLPVTLFAIILVNFVILNLVPGDPVTQLDRSMTGEAERSTELESGGEESHHLQFREHYGLTKPILLNFWGMLTKNEIEEGLKKLASRKINEEEMSVHTYHQLKTLWGDRASYILPLLLDCAKNETTSLPERRLALNLFIRGGTRMGYVGSALTKEKKEKNRQISQSNQFLSAQKALDTDTNSQLKEKAINLSLWLSEHPEFHRSNTLNEKMWTIFLDTRFFRYLQRVIFLDFGTLRNDSHKTVISEVAKRLKYSLTLAVLPMFLTFALCQIFGMLMAYYHKKWVDHLLNITFLILFAIPVFVTAPFLIENFSLNQTLPFLNISLPYSGFHRPMADYIQLTSIERLGDISLHLVLPLISVMYGTLAVQSRLSRTAFLEVMSQNHVRTARAMGFPLMSILWKHVARNGAITIMTSLATSLGVILGGSLIVETVFEINGFGKFFYEAILNRDYNVVLFSAFASSLLSLIGYLIADLSYTFLDPRVTLNNQT